MFVFGDWIKDTQHGEYFELHPIKALYLICTTEAGDDWELVRDLTAYPESRRGFPVELITADDLTTMCRLVTDAETQDPDDTKILRTAAALSMAGGVR